MNVGAQKLHRSNLQSLPLSAALWVGLTIFASSAEVVTLSIKDHRFAPNELTVTAGERFRLEVENRDSTPPEFESGDLRIEKIIVPGGKITIMAGPLKPGTYKFFDEYHPDTAKGTMTAVSRKE